MVFIENIVVFFKTLISLLDEKKKKIRIHVHIYRLSPIIKFQKMHWLLEEMREEF